METRVVAGPEEVARAAAGVMAAEARAAAASRGRFVLALSGGRTPGSMLRALAAEDLPWPAVHVLQVDERVAPAGDADRNLVQLRQTLLGRSPLSPDRIYPMPVEDLDLDSAARSYARLMESLAGAPPVIDLAHLGLGSDGHTASLVPGDPVLEVTDRDVAVTGVYRGRRRMTLTRPALDRARLILWVVTGADKMGALARLRAGDQAIPAGRVRQERALLLADRAAAGDNAAHDRAATR